MPPKPTGKVVKREGQRGARIDPKGCKVRTSVKEQLEALDVHKTVVGRACRRVHLERSHASADHKPRIDQHQRRALRPQNRKTTSNMNMNMNMIGFPQGPD